MTCPPGIAPGSAEEAFLRGQEGLAASVLVLAGVAPAGAEAAVCAALRDWAAGNRPQAPSEWRLAFWDAVIWSPLARPGNAPAVAGVLEPITRLPLAARMAVLLQLAGLPLEEAAALMRRPCEAWEATLQAALVGEGGLAADAVQWASWRDALMQHAAATTPQRRLAFAAARAGQPAPTAAHTTTARAPAPPSVRRPTATLRTPISATGHPRRWRGWAVAAAVVAVLTGALGWVFWRAGPAGGVDETPDITTRALAGPGPSPYVPAPANPTAADVALVQDLPFLAWYAQQRASSPAPTVTVPLQGATDATGLEASDVP